MASWLRDSGERLSLTQIGLNLRGRLRRLLARPAYAGRVIRCRFEFIGDGPLPRPDNVLRDAPIVVGTLELYGAVRYLVVGVDEDANPPIAVLRKVRN